MSAKLRIQDFLISGPEGLWTTIKWWLNRQGSFWSAAFVQEKRGNEHSLERDMTAWIRSDRRLGDARRASTWSCGGSDGLFSAPTCYPSNHERFGGGGVLTQGGSEAADWREIQTNTRHGTRSRDFW